MLRGQDGGSHARALVTVRAGGVSECSCQCLGRREAFRRVVAEASGKACTGNLWEAKGLCGHQASSERQRGPLAMGEAPQREAGTRAKTAALWRCLLASAPALPRNQSPQQAAAGEDGFFLHLCAQAAEDEEETRQVHSPARERWERRSARGAHAQAHAQPEGGREPASQHFAEKSPSHLPAT